MKKNASNPSCRFTIGNVFKCRLTGELWVLSELLGPDENPTAWFCHAKKRRAIMFMPVEDMDIELELTGLKLADIRKP